MRIVDATGRRELPNEPYTDEIGFRGERDPGSGWKHSAVAFSLGARSSLGRVLDAQRALAGPDHSLALAWILRPRGQPSRSAVFRPDRAVLDRPSIVQHLPGLLHRGLSAAPAIAADPVRCPSVAGNRRVLCCFPSIRLGVAVEPRGTFGGACNSRLRLCDVSLCRAAFRRAVSLPHAGRSERLHSHEKNGSHLRARGRRCSCFPRRHSRRSGCLSGPMGRSLGFL